jgi:hypothetical protein
MNPTRSLLFPLSHQTSASGSNIKISSIENFPDNKTSGGIIKTNHIFSCNYLEDKKGNNLFVNIRRSNLVVHKVHMHKIIHH